MPAAERRGGNPYMSRGKAGGGENQGNLPDRHQGRPCLA